VESIRYAARVGYELGVDIVETRMPEDTEDFQSIKQMCPVPLIFGDRSQYSKDEYVNNIKITTRSGYDGVSISSRSLNTSFEELITLTNKGLNTT
jgi:DhnA family fructose-bisphosphate aldolase class Ia